MHISYSPIRIGRLFFLLLGMAIAPSHGSAATSTNSTIPSIIVPWTGKSKTINIGKYFPTPFVPANASVTFPSNSVYVNTSMGDFYIQLFPTNTPSTVANFLRYVTNGLYNGMTIERSVTNFVIQTGGYDITPSLSYSSIKSFGTITSEAGLSNLRGTVAMALSSGSNTATSAWFVNLTDNSSLLDGTNDGGPFTVFGQVQGISGSTNNMGVIDAIEALPTQNYGSPFTDLPLRNWGSNSSLAYTNLVIVTNMVAAIPSAVFSDTNTFSIGLQNTNLTITPLAQSTSPATVYINTLDTNGKLVSKTFQISTRKFPQTINFNSYNYVTYSTNLYTLTNFPTVSSGASIAASGLPVTISIASGPASTTNVVTSGVTNTMIQLKGSGWVQIVAKQSGNFCYNAAPAVSGWLQVYKAPQSITFTNIPDQTNYSGPITLILTNYPTASSGLPVTVSVKSGKAKMIPGGHGQTAKALTLLGTGTVTLIATQPGNSCYYDAITKTNSFVVTPAP